jgi:hypothetical protein
MFATLSLKAKRILTLPWKAKKNSNSKVIVIKVYLGNLKAYLHQDLITNLYL